VAQTLVARSRRGWNAKEMDGLIASVRPQERLNATSLSQIPGIRSAPPPVTLSHTG